MKTLALAIGLAVLIAAATVVVSGIGWMLVEGWFDGVPGAYVGPAVIIVSVAFAITAEWTGP